MGRLLSCTAGGKQEDYSFDALGNRTAWKVNGIGKAAYSYDAMNRLMAMVQDGTAYSYDKRGNLTEERQGDSLIRQYVYDTADRMVTGKNLVSGAQTDYAYNALHMRIGNTVTRQEAGAPQTRATSYVPDVLSAAGNDLMAYHDGGGITKAVYGISYERLGCVTAAGKMYEMPDLWGSPLYRADPQGNAVWRREHDIWGRPGGQEADTDLRFTDYSYDPVTGKYFAQARFYDSAQGRMLSPDPVKRGLNPYPYCDNDPVNYVDPTGEIPTILAGGFLGGIFGGGAGFVGSVLSQVTDGRKINWRKAAGSAANGFVVGAARGALIGSGAGIPLAFATDFTAGSIGDALEQKITTGRVNRGKSLLGGAENALSQMLYGTGELKGVGDAFWRGAKTGALSSGFRNIEETLWPERSRDPKGMCGSPDPLDLAQGFGNGRGYHSASAHGEGGFSLGGLVKDMVVGGIVGGLGSEGFYGAGKALDALKSSAVGRRNSGTLNDGLGALDWKHTNRKGQTALEHVQKHGIPNYQREMHGVFRSDIQTVVESAWANRGNARVIADGMGGIVYNIPYQNVGYNTGYINFGQQMNYVTIVVQEGTSTVWTAFPSFGDYGMGMSKYYTTVMAK